LFQHSLPEYVGWVQVFWCATHKNTLRIPSFYAALMFKAN